MIVRLGADRESLPKDVPTGWDFEKYLFIPGIYDSVELILTGAPYVVNVQTVPDIAGQGRARGGRNRRPADKPCDFAAECRGLRGGKRQAGRFGRRPAPAHLAAGEQTKVDVTIPDSPTAGSGRRKIRSSTN